MKKVLCLGILVADVIVETVTEYPEKGVLLPVDSITVHNGGNAMTATVNLSKLGVEASIIGMVGNDMFGHYLKERLNECGANTYGVKVNDSVQTSASVLMIDKMGERSFFHCTGTNAVFSYDDIDFDIVNQADMVFVTGSFLLNKFDGEDTMRFLKKCKELGKTTFLDVCWDASGRWGEIIDCCMPYIDFFMPSIDEANQIAKKQTPDEIADVFFKKGIKNVIIKLGSIGAYLRKNGEGKGTIYPSYKGIKVVDTTGAGDSFCSGFLAEYARDKSLEDCVRFANATGAHSVMAKGATTGMKTYEEVKEFMYRKDSN